MKLPLAQATLDRLHDWLFAQRSRHPIKHLEGYMNRWWVFRLGRWGADPDGEPFPFIGARLHEILRSDDDRHLHDHPFAYITLILKGGYVEVQPHPDGEYITHRPPGSLLFRRATSLHRLIVPEGKTCTTLFITLPGAQVWGFLTEEGKIPARAYETWKQGFAARNELRWLDRRRKGGA